MNTKLLRDENTMHIVKAGATNNVAGLSHDSHQLVAVSACQYNAAVSLADKVHWQCHYEKLRLSKPFCALNVLCSASVYKGQQDLQGRNPREGAPWWWV